MGVVVVVVVVLSGTGVEKGSVTFLPLVVHYNIVRCPCNGLVRELSS